MRGSASKSQEHCAPRRGSKPVLGRRAQNFRAIGISKDKARVLRHDIGGYGPWDCKKEPVAMGAVVLPFGIGAKICDRGFDLNDMDRGIRCKRDDICAPARDERQFGDRRKVKLPQQPPGAARNKERGFRLAAVLQGEGLEQFQSHGRLTDREGQ